MKYILLLEQILVCDFGVKMMLTRLVHTQLSAGVPAKLTINTKDKYHWFVFYNDLQQNSLDITSNFLDGGI